MGARVKQEEQLQIPNEPSSRRRRNDAVRPIPPPESVINLSSSSSSGGDSDSDSAVGELDSVIATAVQSGVGSPTKKRKVNDSNYVLPVGFLTPLPPLPPPPSSSQQQPEPEPLLTLPPPAWASTSASPSKRSVTLQGCKQFWKAGDYDGGSPGTAFEASTGAFLLPFLGFFNFNSLLSLFVGNPTMFECNVIVTGTLFSTG